MKTLDPSRDAAKLTFKNTPVRRVGVAGEGFELVERIFDRAAVLLAFEQPGGADRCLEMAKEYALERYAFGRVIGGYQAIMRDPATGVYWGASESRKDGAAIGY